MFILEWLMMLQEEVFLSDARNSLNSVRGDGVFHGLAWKFFRGRAFEDAVGREHQRHLREAPSWEISEPFTQHTIRAYGVFHGLAGNFF
jgi:hypothetical protein